MNFVKSAICVFAVFAFTARAHAVTLYASTAAGASGELYKLDSTTGTVIQDIGPLNGDSSVNYPMTGLAFDPVTGILWGSTGNSPASTAALLVTIDPATGFVTEVGSFNTGYFSSGGTPATMGDIAFDAAGNLYGIGTIGGAHLYSINKSTGQATQIGNSGFTATGGGGIAIGPTGTIYGTPRSSMFGTYNLTTGVYTNISDPAKPAGTGAYTALDFNGGVLYGLNTGPSSPPPTHIVTIDTTTGIVTDIGSSLNSLDAIAFQPGPAGIVGDYNKNGVVDAADYVVYRKNVGTSNILPNDPTGGTIGPVQYNQWRSHFDMSSGAGLGAGAVPEPSSFVLLASCMALQTFGRRCRRLE